MNNFNILLGCVFVMIGFSFVLYISTKVTSHLVNIDPPSSELINTRINHGEPACDYASVEFVRNGQKTGCSEELPM